MDKNFFSYTDCTGMQFHATGKEAKEAAEKGLRTFTHNGVTDPKVMRNATWGEVTERAADTGAGYVLKNSLRLAYEAAFPQVVDGRMRNGNDDLVLVKNIHETDLLYHDLVLGIAVIWKSLAGKIERFKGYNFRDVQAVLALLNEKYGVKRGGTDGNMQFFTVDRSFKLAIAIQKKIDFGPELQAAEAKLMEAMEEMTATTGDAPDSANAADLKTIVTAAFKLVDGKLRVSEVLRLRSYKIENALWNEAMDIIDAAIIVTSKKRQIRLYERNDVGAYVAIPLDIAAL
jgi:hypothetical protein